MEFIVHHNAFERPDYHVECVWMHMKRDPQKRPTYLKRDLHLLEFIVRHNVFKQPTKETWYIRKDAHDRSLYIRKETYKKDLQKRPTYMKRNLRLLPNYWDLSSITMLNIWTVLKKETYIYEKRHAKETSIYEMTYTWDQQKGRINMKRVLYLIELIVFHNIFYEKRPTKETDIYEKRGICMKRDQLFLKSIVNHTVCLEQRPIKKTCMYEKCPQKKPVYMKRGLQKRPTNEKTCIYATRVILSYICNDICYESHTRSLSTERDMKFFANQTEWKETWDSIHATRVTHICNESHTQFD